MEREMARIMHRRKRVGAADVFYRETVPETNDGGRPPVLLLHGFPSASHQFRSLMELLGDRIRMIAPDLPGFGHTQIIAGAEDVFEYSFDNLSRTIEELIDALNLESCVMYVFDYGGPVGFRIAARRPGLVAGLIIQNANAYDVGLSDAARYFAAIDQGDAAGVAELERLLTPAGIKFQYETGVQDPEAISPDAYSMDEYFMNLPGRKAANLQLLLNYKANLMEYPAWQSWLRERLPPALIIWGRNDPLFIEAGARAYLADLPHAELQLFNTGHFALEECLAAIAPLVEGFVENSALAPSAEPRPRLDAMETSLSA
ncbi:alpha/beta fold hydrolase [Rhizobium lentis]|uniref:Alpha/beta hydrolase n=1 Tax=Rhizobium lentis TaxID=1138194 RepID=A0ABS7ICX7_9HYPH|nr:alpha/beta hydrolase [Rhizobium lentis]MBX5088352.1 alpha/beta hydrolase [Rhizobium lentis]